MAISRPGIALLLLAIAALTGCGQKGPLFLPKPPTSPADSNQPATPKP